MFTYLYTGGNYSNGTGVTPPASSLPAYAHIDYFRIYPSKPSTTPAVPALAATPLQEDQQRQHQLMLPKMTFSKPPIVLPARSARRSVARRTEPASTAVAMIALMKESHWCDLEQVR
jgi:hypothetical protein